MRIISTIGILIFSANISLFSVVYYTYSKFTPVLFFLLSFAFLAIILLSEYSYRRFKIILPDSIFETITLFQKYLYLFAVGTILSILKLIIYLNNST